MSKITYPQLRAIIEDAVEGFSDVALQKRAWIERVPKSKEECPSFSDALHWLFDDSGLDEGVYACVGSIFYNVQEAKCVDDLMRKIDAILNKYGRQQPAKTFLSAPEWPAIVDSAGVCLQTLKTNDQRARSP